MIDLASRTAEDVAATRAALRLFRLEHSLTYEELTHRINEAMGTDYETSGIYKFINETDRTPLETTLYKIRQFLGAVATKPAKKRRAS